MKAFVTNYNHTPEWLSSFTDDYEIYDRSDSKEYLKDFPQEKITYEDNIGDADYSKLTWLVENYQSLPDVFLWTKSNLFKFITSEEWDKVKDNQVFTPLLTQGHKTYEDERGQVCYYQDGWYFERNDSWYLNSVPSKYFRNYGEFARAFHLPNPPYLKFAPGGSYILTREKVHRYAVDFYDELRSTLPYCERPGEAQFCERAYGSIWG